MIPLSLAEIAQITSGRLSGTADPGTVVTGPVVVDSRLVTPGSLFVALPGTRVDGHEFADLAISSGAVGVLAGHEVGVPAVIVTDPLIAMGELARAVLDQLADRITVIGVTGSVGKTTTKDLIAHLLSSRGRTVAPVGSFNNDLGMPLTMLRADPGTRFVIAEMGSRGIGHVRRLCRIAPPRIGVVLTIGSAHLGAFGDRSVTAKAKGELVEALPPDGVAVLNADDPLVSAMAERTRARVVLFGTSQRAQVRAERIGLDDRARANFRLHTPQGAAEVQLALVGEHHVSNALAAAAVALEAGLSPTDIADLLAVPVPMSRWRMEVTDRGDGVTVVNDSYNANPESMTAALEASTRIARGTGRLWAVLGEMIEIGEDPVVTHRRIGVLARDLGVDRLIAVGPGGLPYAEGFDSAPAVPGSSPTAPITWRVPDVEEALAVLRAEVVPGDVVLVKASRMIGLDRVAQGLLAGTSHDLPSSTPSLSHTPEVPR